MNWNIFWGIYILIFDIAIFIVAYLVGWKSMHKKERCNKKTEGTVIRYSNIRYNGVNLPVIEYTVNDQNYKVVGPKFKAGIKKYISTPFSNPIAKQKTNLNTREDLPDVKVNVYYDEKNQKFHMLKDMLVQCYSSLFIYLCF